MPTTCLFEFDKPHRVYYSGEVINGRIILKTTKDKSVQGIAIIFLGISKVRWQESRTDQSDGTTRSINFRADVVYLNPKTYVLGSCKLPAGTHIYTFSIPLPHECPTSCVAKYGKTHYELGLILERSILFDYKFVQPISVINQMDLNMNPQYSWPLITDDIIYFCCWPCLSRPVISTLSLPYSGYAPGQILPYRLEIDNQSHGYDVNNITFKLTQRFSFTAFKPERKTRTLSNLLGQVELQERCLRLSKRVLRGELHIPGVPPTTITPKSIIGIDYYLEIIITTDGCRTNSYMIMPIIIGTVPLQQSLRQLAISSNANNSTAPDILEDSAAVMPPSYEICLPPTFEEATNFGDKFEDPDIDTDINRQTDWLPKYPIYKYSAEQLRTLSASRLLQSSAQTTESYLQPNTSIRDGND